MRGKFITFEGGEGTGKSTQAALLAEYLRRHGIEVVLTREPGGSPGAEILRHVLLSGAAKSFGSFAEALLFAAARTDHVTTRIQPALERGAWVISDRFMDSTSAYQGVLGQIDPQQIDALERIAINGTRPDLTLVLDVPVRMALERAHRRRSGASADRFEAEDAAFHQRLRSAFQTIARSNPQRCKLIDASQPVNDIAGAVRDIVDSRLLMETSGTSGDE